MTAKNCEQCIYFENRYTYTEKLGGKYFGICTWGHKIKRSNTKGVQRTLGYKRVCCDFFHKEG